ncbi:MAG: hypothetical protein ACRDKG_03605 [Actinomycetota bacterium]
MKPILIDPLNRRLYLRLDFVPGPGVETPRVVEYDLSTRVPTILRNGRLPLEGTTAFVGLSANTIALDAPGRRAFVLDHPQSGDCPACSIVRFWDLKTLAVRPETWNLTTLVPNFSALGITYAAEEDRLYAVGTLAGEGAQIMSQIVGPPLLPTAVVAIDARNGSLAWVKPIAECQHPGVVTPGLGASIFRSKRLAALYIPCIRPQPVAGIAYPGQSALIRLWITPSAGAAESLTLRREVFPISGVYANGGGLAGMAVFDEAAERVYMLNQSTGTSGAWVFDGRLSAWVGFVPAGDESNLQLGINQATGHMYMRFSRGDAVSGANAPILVTDGRATPVPQGETFRIGISQSSDWILSDPLTARIFVRKLTGANRPPQVLVLRDHTPSAQRERLVDFDELTTDVQESARTFATFQGSVRGFGARASLVGGYSGVLSPVYESTNGPTFIPGLKPSPRSVILGRAASLDLSGVSASASAQAISPDEVTSEEYETNRKELGAEAGGAGSAIADQLVWAWPAAVCVDAEGKLNEAKQEAPIGRSTVRCDLKTEQVSASTTSGGMVLDGVSLDGGSFVSKLARTARDGTVAEATATVRGIEISLPGVGGLSIARVAATVRTVAHGRPGTARVQWIREIDGVLVTDSSGTAVFRCPEDCSPKAVADAVNENIGQRVHVSIPDAELTATPRGAFAGIRETEPNYLDGRIVNDDDARAVPALELLVINDTAEKSRLQLQLAAIQASSIYGISLTPQGGDMSTPPFAPVPGLPPVADLGPQPSFGNVPPLAAGPGATIATSRSSIFAVRSGADAFFLSLICLLVVAVVAGGVRRHRFAALLSGGPRR